MTASVCFGKLVICLFVRCVNSAFSQCYQVYEFLDFFCYTPRFLGCPLSLEWPPPRSVLDLSFYSQSCSVQWLTEGCMEYEFQCFSSFQGFSFPSCMFQWVLRIIIKDGALHCYELRHMPRCPRNVIEYVSEITPVSNINMHSMTRSWSF